MGPPKTCTPSKRIFLFDSSCILYHPPGADDNFIREHSFNSLAAAESIYPNCALLVAGDFNQLDITRLKRHFQLDQIVEKPTRKDAILDLVLTNLHDHYNKPQIFPPFGLSDHNTISVSALARQNRLCSQQIHSQMRFTTQPKSGDGKISILFGLALVIWLP